MDSKVNQTVKQFPAPTVGTAGPAATTKQAAQPKWLTDAMASKGETGSKRGVQPAAKAPASTEDRVTALEKLLDRHGIRPHVE